MIYWLAAIVGVGLLVGSAYLFSAEYTAGRGTSCGSLARMSETVHYTPPNDGGCSSAKTTRVVLFLVTGLAGLVLVVGGVGGGLWTISRSSRSDGIGRSRPSAASLP
jgi:hypothetical protein